MTSNSTDELIALASAGDLSQLETILLKEKEPPLAEDVQELLTTAAKESHTDVVNFLLTKYASVPLNEEIVRSAVRSGSIPIMKALLVRDPSAINMPFDHYGSPLIVACMGRKNIDYLRYLLEAGADPNQDPDAATFPLAIVAALSKDPAVIDILLQHGAKLEHSGALGASARLGNELMMGRLLERGARSETDAICPSERGSPLHTAVVAGHVGVTRMLMQHGADLKALDGNGMMPFDIAKKMQEKGRRGTSPWDSNLLTPEFNHYKDWKPGTATAMATPVQGLSIHRHQTSTMSEVECRTRFCQRCEKIPFDEGAFHNCDAIVTASDTGGEILQLFPDEHLGNDWLHQRDVEVNFELVDNWPQLPVITKSAENCDFCRLLVTRLSKTELPPEFRHAWIRVELFYCWWNRDDPGLTGLKALVWGKAKQEDEFTRLVW
ncbi:hypothetical protein FIE12Z_10822 [Fusarium flagelliforme]|uniref:Uncharacterized protein n=1 Tax=Fusarium flagelliforme TaxID=2675880 RepID=A0A395MAI5_9HYPO|nr:hypothetical protein FIE12Z_10822 [Fusarium flagelliforme]